MKKEKFEKLARETGANKCISFDWTYNKKQTCSKDYITKDILKPCVLLNGCKCEHFNRGNDEV